jgi:methylphosphotriester-DNA--protein-cysteine methyltransferase
MRRFYELVGPDGIPFKSKTPGCFGGHKGLKIFGRLDCPSANRWLKKGFYRKYRVFFRSAEDAIAAGYRPCKICNPLLNP